MAASNADIRIALRGGLDITAKPIAAIAAKKPSERIDIKK